MKKKHIFSVIFLAFSMSASAQIQLLYTQTVGRNVIDRNKKLYWMEGDDDPCYDILNYKKAGNKETFTLRNKDKGSDDSYNVVITLNEANVPKELSISGKYMESQQVLFPYLLVMWMRIIDCIDISTNSQVTL